jgi:hypothetical protein
VAITINHMGIGILLLIDRTVVSRGEPNMDPMIHTTILKGIIAVVGMPIKTMGVEAAHPTITGVVFATNKVAVITTGAAQVRKRVLAVNLP